MDPPTPKITFLLDKLIRQFADLSDNLERLNRHLNPIKSDDCLILEPSLQNIVDRDKEKQLLKRRWKIVLQDIIDEAISYDVLQTDPK